MFLVTGSDGSIYGADSKVLHFSAQHFYDDVVKGNCCFVCGRKPSKDVPFNDEHVIPNWILRRYSMHDQTIGLPNGRSSMYGRYKVPCCVECNSALGEKVEEPVRELLSGGIAALRNGVSAELGCLLFSWCSLIFLKTHLKDLRVKWNPDPRQNENFNIGQTYDWQSLHHIQCMARAPVVRAKYGYGSIGTLMVREAWTPKRGRYDYCDFSFAYTSMLQLDDMAIFAVMNDSKMCEQVLESDFDRLGKLSPLQTRELTTVLAETNRRITPRPVHKTTVEVSGERTIVAEVPERFDLAAPNNEISGQLLSRLVEGMPLEPGLLAEVRNGKGSFVYREDGSFIEHDFFVDPDDVASPTDA